MGFISYQLDLRNLQKKKIYRLSDDFRGVGKNGEEISFTNYYMEKNGKPFFGISGEFHYSRMEDSRWEDELLKMKMCGINVVSTYVFWIHHEEEEGRFRFDGRRNLRKFIELCRKHGLYVILRVGPFDHGEVRNGGIPDWMYGMPFEVRKLSEGFLYYVRRLYTELAGQTAGLFFKDGGPIIGVQIDNEYMHSSAPWEITSGVANEWVFGGDEGEAYMLRLKDLAAECGLLPAFYTCTAWGGAATPDSMMPLWGGYAFRPWLFYSHEGEHPATEEYVYQDFHKNGAACNYDFKPCYQPEERPYACCEMGGGMTCSYYYRFAYPFKGVDAMANIKMASGCNFLGYYMFQGGSNPLGINGLYLNEGQVPKISYDYQAALGEFGQIRESYRRLKSLHYFVNAFGDRLCAMQTVLPEGASFIDPKDGKTLRFAVRTDGKRGFLFINNYQDHYALPDRSETVTLHLTGEDISFAVDIAGDENAVLPFHFDMDGIDLVWASAQPITRIAPEGESTFVFFVPDGMKAKFVFEEGIRIDGEEAHIWKGTPGADVERFLLEKEGRRVTVLVLGRTCANRMYLLSGDRLAFTKAALLEDEKGIRLESTEAVNLVETYPAGAFQGQNGSAATTYHIWQNPSMASRGQNGSAAFLGRYVFQTEEKEIPVTARQVAASRYAISLPEGFLDGVKDVLLQVEYTGNIGQAFIHGRMINDNFANGKVWEIGLKDHARELQGECITLYIVPLKEGVKVNVESSMAARSEEVGAYIVEVKSVRAQPVYETPIS